MQFTSKIYIDGGDPQETQKANDLLISAGFSGLDGQTTNPSLIAKNLSKKNGGNKVSNEEANAEYKKIVQEMSAIIPSGKISIQVIADPQTVTTEELLSQARERIQWIPNGVIKFPITHQGLAAAAIFCKEGPVNMTLNFSQSQGAAVYAATKEHISAVYISPFVGRLDDKGQNGMDVVINELDMYAHGDNHVQVLTASVRTIDHILCALHKKSHVITIPYQVFTMWAEKGFPQPDASYIYPQGNLTTINKNALSLDNAWNTYDISHELTTTGLAKFWEDWKSIVNST